MNQMISVLPGFQSSVNIAYDLPNEARLGEFIPTQGAMELLKSILRSTASNATDRARILIGAYGTGKSHIMLMILSVLMKRDLRLFHKAYAAFQQDYALRDLLTQYYEKPGKILPVVVTGSSVSLSQSLLQALQRTLAENGLSDVMPETNYAAAAAVICRWRADYPDTFHKLEELSGMPAAEMLDRLAAFDPAVYHTFEQIHPQLTAGSVFNPFLGQDAADLYESVATCLREKGYSGIYIVYDEYSKYLEANIRDASVSDTKMLQDLAERCCRSGELQLHIMLISHKEISNYIDQLPKEKVDGWRGVSGRFQHVRLDNSYSQTYEIISSVLVKEPVQWQAFREKHADAFSELRQRYERHPMFLADAQGFETVLDGCYPLHPATTFILPRLSNRVAQNERTLFTFLSDAGQSSLPRYLETLNPEHAEFVMPDMLYDYFLPLLRREVGEEKKICLLTERVLAQLPADSLPAKLVRTVALITILGQYERLKPTMDELASIYASVATQADIAAAVSELEKQNLVVYQQRSNGFLRLKESSGVDVRQSVRDYAVSKAQRVSVPEILSRCNPDCWLYPSAYNDAREMTRSFAVSFVNLQDIDEQTDWDAIAANNADGMLWAVLADREEDLPAVKTVLLKTSEGNHRDIFVLPRKVTAIEKTAREYYASDALAGAAEGDPVLWGEYDMIREDLREILCKFISGYIHPEYRAAEYIHDGIIRPVRRKAELSALLSMVTEQVYPNTPVICCEALNRTEPTRVAAASRSKVTTALLRPQLEPNLGLTGSGQEVSILRSTLIRTGVFVESEAGPTLRLQPEDPHMSGVLAEIVAFLESARGGVPMSFSELYENLTGPEKGIGLRRGLIPIYLAAVLHGCLQQAVILDSRGEVPLTSELLLQINGDPGAFSVSLLDWGPEKERFAHTVRDMFAPEGKVRTLEDRSAWDAAVGAMIRWWKTLPRWTQETAALPNGAGLPIEAVRLRKLLSQGGDSYSLLFEKLPQAMGAQTLERVSEELQQAKDMLDRMQGSLEQYLIDNVCGVFSCASAVAASTMAETVQAWCDTLPEGVFQHIFSDGTDRLLPLLRHPDPDDRVLLYAMARVATGLRMEEWDRNMPEAFLQRICRCKETAERYEDEPAPQMAQTENGYQVIFSETSGSATVRTFQRVPVTPRGQLLRNQIRQAMSAMGRALSEEEKRQVLMEVLRELC